MDEQLNNLLREVILAAQASRQNPVKLAEDAARAFKAGLVAYSAPVSPSVAQPGDRPVDQ